MAGKDKAMVSIIMPAYNAERYIAQAIGSVLAQTYRNWELIVVDDASRDATIAVVESMMTHGEEEQWGERLRFPSSQIRPGDADSKSGEARCASSLCLQGPQEQQRICLLQNAQNRGAAYCRNRGIQVARGEWIAFLDSDDCWLPDKLEAQLSCVDKYPEAQLLFTGSDYMDESGKTLAGTLRVPETLGYRQALKQNLISCSSVLIKRELLLGCVRMDAAATWGAVRRTRGVHLRDALSFGEEDADDKVAEIFPDTRRRGLLMHEDFPVWLMALKRVGTAYGIDRPLLVYRMQRASQSGNKLKAARMTYQVYRYVGLPVWERWYYFVNYALRSLKKYKSIRGVE